MGSSSRGGDLFLGCPEIGQIDSKEGVECCGDEDGSDVGRKWMCGSWVGLPGPFDLAERPGQQNSVSEDTSVNVTW